MQAQSQVRKFGSEAEMRAFYAGVKKRNDTAPRPPVVTGFLPRPASYAGPLMVAKRGHSGAPVAEKTPVASPELLASKAAVEEWLQAFAVASGVSAETWRTETGSVQQNVRAYAAAGAVRVDGAHPGRVLADLGLPQTVYQSAFKQFPLFVAALSAPMIASARLAIAAHIYAEISERRLTLTEIRAGVASVFGVSIADLTSDCRPKTVVVPRHIYFAACKVLTGASFPQIGRHARHDHTTVMRAIKLLRKRVRSGDNDLIDLISLVERELGLAAGKILDGLRGPESKVAR